MAFKRDGYVPKHASEFREGLKSFEELRQTSEGYDFIKELFRLCKIPHKLRDQYFATLKANPGISAEEAFNLAYTSFPLRIVAAPLSKSKLITRIDLLEGKNSNVLVEYYLRRRYQFAAEIGGRAMCLLIRLPYNKGNELHVLHDVDPTGTDLLSCPGNLYSFWVQGDECGETRYRIFMQPAAMFFDWGYIKEGVHNFIGSSGFEMDDVENSVD